MRLPGATLVAAISAISQFPVIIAQSDIPISPALQKILDDSTSDPKYTWPTSLTRDIVPKQFHSHNDYWRQVAVYSALSVGAISIEADVSFIPSLSNTTLFIGHEASALTAQRTFDSLYIQPLLSILHAQNPNNTLVSQGTSATTATTRNGVYDTNSAQTLYLWVDVKTAGASTWPVVVRALQPLRSAGYLTTFNGTAVIPGPITVIGTGNTPLNLVQGVSPRDYFWDAPIPTLNSTFSNITANVSPIASTDFAVQFPNLRAEGFNATQLALLRSQIAVAHGRGIGVRYWDQPGWPVGTRNAVWRTLWNEGVDLLNVDDLEAAANFWDGQG